MYNARQVIDPINSSNHEQRIEAQINKLSSDIILNSKSTPNIVR